jgi:hypothetical protein
MTPEHFREWLQEAITNSGKDADDNPSRAMAIRSRGKNIAYKAVLQMFSQVVYHGVDSPVVISVYDEVCEKIELTTNDGDYSTSGEPVIWEKCCDKLDYEIRTWNAPKRSDRFFDVYVNGTHNPFIGTKHTSGHWQLHYCPYCGTKINIHFKHRF